jgi:hypothetical protein
MRSNAQAFKAGRQEKRQTEICFEGWGFLISRFKISQISAIENGVQRKIWIEMIGSQPVAIEER